MTEVDARRAQLEQELAELAAAENAEKEARQQEAVAQTEAQLAPEQLARKAEIEKRAADALEREYPPWWSPHKKESGHPDTLVGLVLRIDPRVGPSPGWGTYSAVVEVRSTDGREWTIWANEGGALHGRLVALRIQPGEVIAVKYRGMRESQANPGQSYHDYRLVRVDDDESPGALVDYDALTRSNSEPPALPDGGQSPVPGDDGIPF